MLGEDAPQLGETVFETEGGVRAFTRATACWW